MKEICFRFGGFSTRSRPVHKSSADDLGPPPCHASRNHLQAVHVHRESHEGSSDEQAMIMSSEKGGGDWRGRCKRGTRINRLPSYFAKTFLVRVRGNIRTTTTTTTTTTAAYRASAVSENQATLKGRRGGPFKWPGGVGWRFRGPSPPSKTCSCHFSSVLKNKNNPRRRHRRRHHPKL